MFIGSPGVSETESWTSLSIVIRSGHHRHEQFLPNGPVANSSGILSHACTTPANWKRWRRYNQTCALLSFRVPVSSRWTERANEVGLYVAVAEFGVLTGVPSKTCARKLEIFSNFSCFYPTLTILPWKSVRSLQVCRLEICDFFRLRYFIQAFALLCRAIASSLRRNQLLGDVYYNLSRSLTGDVTNELVEEVNATLSAQQGILLLSVAMKLWIPSSRQPLAMLFLFGFFAKRLELS